MGVAFQTCRPRIQKQPITHPTPASTGQCGRQLLAEGQVTERILVENPVIKTAKALRPQLRPRLYRPYFWCINIFIFLHRIG